MMSCFAGARWLGIVNWSFPYQLHPSFGLILPGQHVREFNQVPLHIYPARALFFALSVASWIGRNFRRKILRQNTNYFYQTCHPINWIWRMESKAPTKNTNCLRICYWLKSVFGKIFCFFYISNVISKVLLDIKAIIKDTWADMKSLVGLFLLF